MRPPGTCLTPPQHFHSLVEPPQAAWWSAQATIDFNRSTGAGCQVKYATSLDGYSHRLKELFFVEIKNKTDTGHDKRQN